MLMSFLPLMDWFRVWFSTALTEESRALVLEKRVSSEHFTRMDSVDASFSESQTSESGRVKLESAFRAHIKVSRGRDSAPIYWAHQGQSVRGALNLRTKRALTLSTVKIARPPFPKDFSRNLPRSAFVTPRTPERVESDYFDPVGVKSCPRDGPYLRHSDGLPPVSGPPPSESFLPPSFDTFGKVFSVERSHHFHP
ncbi:hypothetical protein CDAR_567541 [Caerostris darwini]|uniref:Uncharacterized protein n=1 Tax=Caerostris darwini TaxID=1538125 RepID=A0AAV4QWJ9_9ARAC|nr:hypothetical protein CDAR_567541 [Caerostris darwini]